MKNKLIFAAMACAMLLSLAACGGGNDAETEDTSTEEEFTPMEVQENNQIDLGEDESVVIH